MFTFYVHFAKPSSRLGMYITTAPIVGLDCVQAETADEFTELIKHQKPEFVMFQVGVSFPRRPVDVDGETTTGASGSPAPATRRPS